MKIEPMLITLSSSELVGAMNVVRQTATLVQEWKPNDVIAMVVYSYGGYDGPKLEDIKPVSLRNHFGPQPPRRHVLEARFQSEPGELPVLDGPTQHRATVVNNLEATGTPFLNILPGADKQPSTDKRYIRWQRVW